MVAGAGSLRARFSALQRAEIAEIVKVDHWARSVARFSALQRAEIAEINIGVLINLAREHVSVLFNEPKLLKSRASQRRRESHPVSVLFNEPKLLKSLRRTNRHNSSGKFQCSSTSRNC